MRKHQDCTCSVHSLCLSSKAPITVEERSTDHCTCHAIFSVECGMLHTAMPVHVCLSPRAPKLCHRLLTAEHIWHSFQFTNALCFVRCSELLIGNHEQCLESHLLLHESCLGTARPVIHACCDVDTACVHLHLHVIHRQSFQESAFMRMETGGICRYVCLDDTILQHGTSVNFTVLHMLNWRACDVRFLFRFECSP